MVYNVHCVSTFFVFHLLGMETDEDQEMAKMIAEDKAKIQEQLEELETDV